MQSISVRPSDTPVRLSLETLGLQARVVGQDGSELTDRPVIFNTSNSRVVSIQSTGLIATLTAVGGGTATITATSEGKVSVPIQVIVAASCCGVGEGAPTTSIQQAFQDAVTRNRLSLQLPGPQRVRRSAAGYVQEFSGAAGGRYLLAVSDKTGQAYVVAGPILSRYEELGAMTSALGYPASDATSGGRQMFEGGALAGAPVRVVSGGVLQRWSTGGFESGSLRSPTNEAAAVLSFLGTVGSFQPFQQGAIVTSSRGSFALTGLVLARYSSLGLSTGALGFALGDEISSGGVRRQEFEGGSVEYAPLDTEARVSLRDRKPAVSAAPAAVLPGSSLRLTVSGFADGSTLRISTTSQSDFMVKTLNGAYTWDSLIPAGAASATVKIKATDSANAVISAEGEYRIRAAAEVRARLEIAGGDSQSGAPGASVPSPLRVLLKDEQGNLLPGVTVRFSASPGAQVTPGSVETDASGAAAVRLRLPAAEGIALVTAEALRQVVTFSAKSVPVALQSFPRLTQSPDEPAMLTAAATVIRYYQNRNALVAPNGLADSAVLDRFLNGFCQTDAEGAQHCDGILREGQARAINLWRLPAFVGGALDIIIGAPDLQEVREAVGSGNPALLILSTGQVLVAIGVSDSGAVLIHDVAPSATKRTLEEYLTPTTALRGTVFFSPKTPASSGFAVASWGTDLALNSKAGSCGRILDLPIGPAILRQRYCDGVEGEYQLDLSGASSLRAIVIDLAEGGGRVELAAGSLASVSHFPTG